jgi:hypothetical protein
MATVPNWIAKAVILYSNAAVPITEWRATRTQVVVRTSPTGPERRFSLDRLREVGKGWGAPVLAAPDDPRVVAIREQKIVNAALGDVLAEVERHRLQDSGQAPEDAVRKLTAIRDAATKALAELSEVL